MMSLLHIGLCLLLVVGMLTCLGGIFDIDWLFCLGALFEFVGAVTMIMALITAFFVNGKYDGVSDGKIKTYSECYKEHGRNVCEDVLNNKYIVEDYWIKGFH